MAISTISGNGIGSNTENNSFLFSVPENIRIQIFSVIAIAIISIII